MAQKKEIKTNGAEAPAVQSKTIVVKHDFKKLVWLVLAVLVGWALVRNPALIEKAKDIAESMLKPQPSVTKADNQNIGVLQDEITALQSEINRLNNQENSSTETTDKEDDKISELNQRFDAFEKTNLSIIDGKADAATVLGIVTRLDALEEQVKILSRATDQSALILTAAMLVKDTADRGRKFDYEVEVLHELAQGNTKLAAPIAVLEKYSRSGIKTNTQLINEFESIYAALLNKQKEEFEKTWKDRLNSKINQIIKVRKVNGEDSAEFEANRNLEQIRSLVAAEEINKAVVELEDVKNAELLQDPAMQNWLNQAKAKVEFVEAVNKISTYSLAVMKVNAIRKEIKND